MGKRTSYESYENFMLRAPLLPVGFLSTIPDLPEQLLPWLKDLWRNPIIREGILLGSYEFSRMADHEFDAGNHSTPDTGIHYSLLRYLCRFSSRCTPFGTFAGFVTGTTGSETMISLSKISDHQLHARPDMEYLMAIAHQLESEEAIREKLMYSPNTSLYRVGSRWHYVEVSKPAAAVNKIYDVVTIDDGGVVEKVLEYCGTGRKLSDIRNFLIDLGWEPAEVINYVDTLVGSQVIVSELGPVLCGPEYIDVLTGHLDHEFVTHIVVQSLLNLKGIFEKMNRPSLVLENLPQINPVLENIPLPVNRNHLVQVDMKLGNSALTVDSHLTGQVIFGLRIMKALSSPGRTDVMKGFREAFIKRYGDRKVQLVKVLDPETGIGLEGMVESYWTDPVPWIDDLRWGPGFGTASSQPDPGNSWLVAKYGEVIRKNQLYLELESSDLQAVDIHSGTWPAQMTAMVELFETGQPGEMNIHFLLGSSGNPAYLLGRFGFADPDATKQWISKLVKDEQAVDPEAVFAEVVHLPEDRTGNVLQRPAFLTYEIPYLARSAKPPDKQIPVTDLLVSIENQRIILYSARSGKRVRPLMTNAYNHQLGHLAVYKFLSRVQLQDPGLLFKPDWGEAVRNSSFTPGIRFKNLILSSPVWSVRCQDIGRFFNSGNNEFDLPALITWKNELQMPDEMLWVSYDQELYFNWTHPNLLMALWDTIRNLSAIKVRPFYLSSGTPVKSEYGSHANQFVFCFRKS